KGPNSVELERLAALPSVRVENRWVPEGEIGALIAWSDALVLPYREASQSGVAAAAIAARRWVVATRVGGLVEQFRGETSAILCQPDAASLRDALLRLAEVAPAAAGAEAGETGGEPREAWRTVAEELLAGIARLTPGRRS
ncbi:MAG: glycosyltransferase, partial [Gluconacetobacter diazotrophicus]|nr:glycosyltransferase [Gluconacetobacter diazotrophicus]